MSTGTHRNGASGSRRGLWIGLGIVVAVLLVVGIVAGTTLAAGGGSPVAGSTTSSAVPSTTASATKSGTASGTARATASSTAAPTASGRSTGTAAAATDSSAAGSSAPSSATATAPSAAAASAAQAAPVLPSGSGKGTEQPSFAAAAKIGQTAPVGQDVSVRVTGITATQGVASAVGERSGPAVRITFELKNNTGRAVSTASAVANVEYGSDRTPADELRGKRPTSFAASIAPGGTATASFTYLVPTDQRGDLRITFFFDPTKPAAQFTGSAT
ncbi:hypothetical protein [Tersicoccus sp. Bi-70]|uniref:hypothetical protein n=1 Tax=Tersicoccus sp. Bi-70 TaxID=1897634 RepID=UPI000978A1B2|nr:hypothetical protein [Tersicoccus sp. Bi-70]OMH31375.1 hypothetical protein BGP79_10195 [Tersicoccus sp. Bi-70]